MILKPKESLNEVANHQKQHFNDDADNNDLWLTLKAMDQRVLGTLPMANKAFTAKKTTKRLSAQDDVDEITVNHMLAAIRSLERGDLIPNTTSNNG